MAIAAFALSLLTDAHEAAAATRYGRPHARPRAVGHADTTSHLPDASSSPSAPCWSLVAVGRSRTGTPVPGGSPFDHGVHKNVLAHARGRPQIVPLRHLRRRGLLGRTRSGCTRRSPARRRRRRRRAQPERRARRSASRSTPTRCRRSCAGSSQRGAGRPRRSRDHARAAAADAVVGVTGFFDAERHACSRSASSARSATRRSTTRSRPASAGGSTAGPTATSTSARSSRSRPTCSRSPTCSASTRRPCAPCSRAGGRASSTPSCCSTARRSGRTASRRATLIPPAFGLAGVNLHTWTGWGSRHLLERVRRQPRDARQGHVLRPAPRRSRRSSRSPPRTPASATCATTPDLITPKLAALHFYQLALAGAAAARRAASTRRPRARGDALFDGQGALRDAATCRRSSPSRAGTCTRADGDRHRRLPGGALARPALPHRAARAASGRTQKGGFYHDGRFATLARRRRPLRRLLRARPRRPARRATWSST